MKLPIDITFRHMEPSEAVRQSILERAEKLERFHERILRCKVIVEAPHRHHHKGKIYYIGIDMTVPGGSVVVSRDPGKNHAHEDIYVAIRDAFDAARRALQDYARRNRQDVKAHEVPPHGVIAELYPDEGYGKIQTPDDRLVYFHENSVLGGKFASLTIGAEVRFDEEAGDRGPQASTVKLIGKHHLA